MENKLKCITKYCRNKKARRNRYCSTCVYKRWKTKNPLKYCFNTLKYNAKRRGKFFDLTFEQFKTFVDETRYMELKGKYKTSLSIDRIEDELGYTFSNIRAITLSDNSTKENYRRKYAHKQPDDPF